MSREQQGVERLLEGVGNLEADGAHSKETDLIWSSIASRAPRWTVSSRKSTAVCGTNGELDSVLDRVPVPLLGQQNLSSLHGIRENLPIFPVHEDDSLGIAGLDETN